MSTIVQKYRDTYPFRIFGVIARGKRTFPAGVFNIMGLTPPNLTIKVKISANKTL